MLEGGTWIALAIRLGGALLAAGAMAACSSGKTATASGVCCAAVDGAGVSSCTCQPTGTVSQSGVSSTLTVSGSSCTTSTTLLGSTLMSTGSVVSSCEDAGAPPAGSDGGEAGPQGHAFTPADIQSKLAFWFDPTSLVASGANVARWSDLSGNGNDAVPDNPSYAPAYAASSIHGLPAATFSGPVTYLRIVDVASLRWGSNDLAILAVIRGQPLTAPEAMLYQKTGASPYDGASLYLNADKPVATTRAAAQISGQVYVVSAPPPATFVDGTVHLLGIRRTATTLEVRVDGAVSNSIVNASVSTDVSAIGTDAIIGQNGYRSPPPAEFQQFHGDIAEMIGVNGSLTQTELIELEQYLKGRYAIP